MNSKPLKSFGNWQYIELLGVGAFGEVHLWRNNFTQQEIVTKRLKHNAQLMADETKILYERWLQEYKWMKSLQTPYIVSAKDITDQEFLNYLMEQNPPIDYKLPVIVMEYCNSGDLRKQLNKVENLNGMNEFEVRNIFRAIIEAIKYLHEKCNIEHRDIKPENIVCHTEGKRKVYKLSDFGYARDIPYKTIAQSVVGTRNYVAPEIIDGGVYSKTIDYFSIGILIYEIICGTQPFIPHQTIFIRIKCIQQKQSDCIAIIQNVNEQNEENRFKFINYILPQNHSSKIFIELMEQWLRSALKNDYKTRGYNNKNELIFYTGAETILSTRIVTVFSLKTFKKFYYNIDTFANLKDFINKICYDNDIKPDNVFVIYPPLHPRKHSQNPVDYFVPEWCDTSDIDNPPVMLFVDEFRKANNCDIQLDTTAFITDTIKKCMNTHPDDIPDWLLQQFEKEVHFILTHEQHIIQCYVSGLHNYVLDIEDHVLKYNTELHKLDKIMELNGCIKHFNVVVDELVRNQQLKNASDEKSRFDKKFQELKNNVNLLIHAYQLVSKQCQDMATNEIFKNTEDIFQLSDYRKFLLRDYTKEKRLERSQIAIDNWLNKIFEFTKNSEYHKIHIQLSKQIETFIVIRQNVDNLFNDINKLESEINDCTRSLLKNNENVSKISNNIDTLLSMKMDGMTVSDSPQNSLYRNNGITSNVFDIETEPILNEFKNTFKSMTQLMEMDQ
ncbi:inhibitor of nuclear factor kappa B kinase subunit beta [Cochliomyia hominivorax]